MGHSLPARTEWKLSLQGAASEHPLQCELALTSQQLFLNILYNILVLRIRLPAVDLSKHAGT